MTTPTICQVVSPPDPIGANIGGAGEVHNVGEIWALTFGKCVVESLQPMAAVYRPEPDHAAIGY